MTVRNDAPWFKDRPRRTERCARCDGHGNVALPYALIDANGLVVPNAPEDAILAFVCGSWDITTACREASEIAKRAKRTVAFEFNGQTVALRPFDDPDTVMRRWWREAYGETPEQTFARR